MNVKNSGKELAYARDPETQEVYTLYPGDNEFNDTVGQRLEKFSPPIETSEQWKATHAMELRRHKEMKEAGQPAAPVKDTTLDKLPEAPNRDLDDTSEDDLDVDL